MGGARELVIDFGWQVLSPKPEAPDEMILDENNQNWLIIFHPPPVMILTLSVERVFSVSFV